MSSYKSRALDQRAANDVVANQELMCAATGCPHRWSVNAGSGRLCSWHAWNDPHLWPRITQEQQDAVANKAHRDQYREPPAAPKAMTRTEKAETIKALRDTLAPRQGRKDWARRIVDNARNGARVTPLVLKMARAVVNRRMTATEVDE